MGERIVHELLNLRISRTEFPVELKCPTTGCGRTFIPTDAELAEILKRRYINDVECPYCRTMLTIEVLIDAIIAEQ